MMELMSVFVRRFAAFLGIFIVISLMSTAQAQVFNGRAGTSSSATVQLSVTIQPQIKWQTNNKPNTSPVEVQHASKEMALVYEVVKKPSASATLENALKSNAVTSFQKIVEEVTQANASKASTVEVSAIFF